MLVKQKVIDVSKKYKNMSTKQESLSDAAFKAWPFHLILILPVKMI